MFRRLIRKMAGCNNNSDDLGKAKAMEAEEALYRHTEELARSEEPFRKRIEELEDQVSDTKTRLGKEARNAQGDQSHLRTQG